MKILLSGFSGFIGSYVLQQLLNRDCEIICIGRKKNEIVENNSRLKYIYYDISAPQDENLFKKFNQPDLFIHLAWEGLPNYKSEHHLIQNLPNDILLIKNLIDNGLRNIVVLGTCFEYGLQEGEMNVEMCTEPVIPYAIAKDTLRKYVEYYCKEKAVKYKWLRLFYVYGHGQGKDSIIPQLEKAIEDGLEYFNMSFGEQIRDYLNVEEMAELIVEASFNNDFNTITNICSGKPIKLKDFISNYITSKEYNIKLNLGFYPYNKYEPMNFWGNCPKNINTL